MVVQQRHGARLKLLRDPTIISLGDASCNARQGLGIPAQRDGIPYRALVARRLEKRGQRLRYGSLTRLVEVICRADFIQSCAEVIAEL